MPHNTAIYEEFIFLLNIFDLERTEYSFDEIVKLMFVEQVKQNKFSEFHSNMPFPIFTKKNPPDYDLLFAKFKEIKKSDKCPVGFPKSDFDELLETDIETFTNNFVERRHKAYKKFLKDFDADDIFETQYKPTKTWRQNWVEFVRDYVDFAAYCGLVPCYYKLPNKNKTSFNGFIVTQKLKDFRAGKLKLEEILMEYKYSNSSVRFEEYKQFFIKVRPFYCVLKILNLLKSKGINQIHNKLLFAYIVRLRNENEIEDFITEISDFIKTTGDLLTEKNTSKVLAEEANRVSIGMMPFLRELELVTISKNGSNTFLSTSKKGNELLKNTFPNTLFFGQYEENSGIAYSPLLALILNQFAIAVKSGIKNIDFNKLLNYFPKISKENLKYYLEQILLFNPSPIKELQQNKILLNDFENQYAVSPYLDFISLDDIDFIQNGSKTIEIQKLEIDKIQLPEKSILNELKDSALSSDGDRFENALQIALNELPGTLIKHGRVQRVTEFLWKIKYEQKKIFVIVEAKSGNAIRQFDDRIAKEQIKNTLLKYGNEFADLKGIWYIIVDSNAIPQDTTHGGFRDNKNQVSFRKKLQEVQNYTMMEFTRPTLVSAFSIDCFIEYYKYLFAKNTENQKTENLSIFTEEFFTKGNLFFNINSWTSVFTDKQTMTKELFI